MLPLGIITVPASRSRNNLTTGASVLDLGTLVAGKLNTKVAALAGGVGGNAITVACTGDSAAGKGVTISRVANALTIHYESGVSTVAAVEAAIKALSGANALIFVDVAGTGATVLTAAGDNFAATNLAGGAAGAFTLPASVRSVNLVTAGADLSFRTGWQANDISAVATGEILVANQMFTDAALGMTGSPGVISAFNAGAAAETLTVFAERLS